VGEVNPRFKVQSLRKIIEEKFRNNGDKFGFL